MKLKKGWLLLRIKKASETFASWSESELETFRLNK